MRYCSYVFFLQEKVIKYRHKGIYFSVSRVKIHSAFGKKYKEKQITTIGYFYVCRHRFYDRIGQYEEDTRLSNSP